MNPVAHLLAFLLIAGSGFIATQRAHAASTNLGGLSQTIIDVDARTVSVTPAGSGGSPIKVTPSWAQGSSPDMSRILGGSYAAGARADGFSIKGSALIPIGGQMLAAELGGGVGTQALIGGLAGFATGGVPGAVLGGGMPLLQAWLAGRGVFFNPDAATKDAQPYRIKTARYMWGAPNRPECYNESSQLAAQCISGYGPADGLYRESGDDSQEGFQRWRVPQAWVGDLVNGERLPDVNAPATSAQAASKMQGAPAPTNPAILKELADKGVSVDLDPWELTGPTTVQGPTTTAQNADGTTTTTSVVNNYTYNNNTVTNAGATTTTVTRNQAGDVVNSSSSTTTGGQSGEGGTPTDTPMPPVPDLYQRKYPQGMEGIWDEQSAAIKQTPLFSLAQNLMPAVGSGGTCPSWPIDLTFAQWSDFGVRDVAPPCWVWDFGKVVIMISALLLARRLIFGG